MLKILKNCYSLRLTLLANKNIYRFSGGHDDHHHDDHHHEIDRESIKLRDEKSGYYLNPNEVARRALRIISLHDKVEDPEKVTLSTQWHEMGLNQLDTVQLLIGLEDEFRIEFPDEVGEKFKDVHDVVQYVSRSFWAE